jgi:hypothetical protein
MKIGIYGDSYADPTQMNPTPSWPALLASKYDVTNHAVAGSNLYYSLTQLLKHSNSYDKNILVVTQPRRIMIPEHYTVSEPRKRFIAGIGTVEHMIKDTENESFMIKFYEAAKQYFILLQDSKYEDYIHRLMITDLIKRVPNLIVIPGFAQSGVPLNIHSIYEIYAKETTAWNETTESVRQYRDIRNCHMTAENNSIFASKVEEWISGSPVYINVNDFVAPTNKEFYLK